MTRSLSDVLKAASARPWRLSGQRLAGPDGKTLRVSGVAIPGGYVADDDQSNANALLLAHAANQIEGLVEALKELDEATRSADRLRRISCGEKLEAAEQREIDAYFQASAALAKATTIDL